jgi:hypothetical protein
LRQEYDEVTKSLYPEVDFTVGHEIDEPPVEQK